MCTTQGEEEYDGGADEDADVDSDVEALHLGMDDVTDLPSLKLSNEVQLKKKVTQILENIMLDGGMCMLLGSCLVHIGGLTG